MKTLLSLLLCVCTLLPATVTSAQEEPEWLEARASSFAVIYPSAYSELALGLVSLYGDTLEIEYQRFAALFQDALQLPISIRIYPTTNDYLNLNALAPAMSPKSTHSHIGSREIALIAENILSNWEAWQQTGLDAFRFELATLFVDHITDNKAPPGLLAGMGGYAQDPGQAVGSWIPPEGEFTAPETTWRTVWESEDPYLNPELLRQATSTVAYLVDVYGWADFQRFLENLRTAEGYRQALLDAYGVEISALEEEWRAYYPLYLQGRWRAHVLYDFDLSAFEQMIAVGAYLDAEQELRQAIEFLESTAEQAKVEEAQALLETASLGKEANTLVSRSRQALQSGDYERSLELARQAREIYDQIDATHRLEELQAYQAWAQEVLDLRAEADELSGRISLRSDDGSILTRLSAVGARLGELGDARGVSQVRVTLESFGERQRARYQIIAVAGALLALILLGFRIWMVRRTPPVEAKL